MGRHRASEGKWMFRHCVTGVFHPMPVTEGYIAFSVKDTPNLLRYAVSVEAVLPRVKLLTAARTAHE